MRCSPPFTIPQNPPTKEAYRRLAGEVEKHFNSQVLDVSFPRCVDKEHGGFAPHFLEDWSKGDANDKTLVFQSRMTWVCARWRCATRSERRNTWATLATAWIYWRM